MHKDEAGQPSVYEITDEIFITCNDHAKVLLYLCGEGVKEKE